MYFPDTVPVLSSEDCKAQLWTLFTNIFPSECMEEVVSAFGHVHCSLLPGKSRGPLKSHSPHTKAILVNVTNAYLGYVDGQSLETLSLLEKVKSKCHRKI